MTEYEKICDFQNLYKAHTRARRGKRSNKEVVEFELNLASNLTALAKSLEEGSYLVSGYYTFTVHDPKDRVIHALHYKDRVVQHCICDEVIAPTLDRKLIYDNAACRLGKGTHFAIRRLSKFLHEFYNRHGTSGWFLKCDIRKFFDNIDHETLKMKLRKAFNDEDVLALLDKLIDSYESSPGKGLPLGNQTSQWFAIYYLDGIDRLIKENFRIKYYTRYMDDFVIVHHDKEYLKYILSVMTEYLRDELGLLFNSKTEIFPIKNGVDYLGWHFYLTDSGKVIRRVRNNTKRKYKRKLRSFQNALDKGSADIEKIKKVMASYSAHLSHGHTYKLQKKIVKEFM